MTKQPLLTFEEPEKQAMFDSWFELNSSGLKSEFIYQWLDQFKDFVKDNFDLEIKETQHKHSEPSWDDMLEDKQKKGE